ncbi:MAG: ATP-binding protein [Desulfobacterales bacterium]
MSKNKKPAKKATSKVRKPSYPVKKKLNLLKLELLKKVDLFNGFPEETIRNLAENCREVVLHDDEILFKEGQMEKAMYVVLFGELLVYKLKKQITVLGPGQYIGEMSLIESKARSASARAITEEVLLVQINETIFNTYFVSQPKVLLTLMKTLSSRVRADSESMAEDMQTLSIFTHDMRNCLVPLGIPEVYLGELIRAFQGTMDGHKKRAGWEKIKKSYDTMMAVRNNMITLIDQSLGYATKRKTEYIKGSVKILPLIRETIDELTCHKYVKGKKLNVKANGPTDEVFCNYLDIKRVLQNLIINAAYVTEKNGEIIVEVGNEGEGIRISVIDRGCGIPEDLRPLLLKETITTKADGNGFGLMSCRDIIEKYHKGKLWFDSEVGKGTAFHFVVPSLN